MQKKYWLYLSFVIGIAGIIIFFHLGSLPLLDPDEPVYAQTAREMLQFQDFISPRIYGDFWYDKPPMYYWLVAGAFKLFGVGEFAARFPSALLALCGVALMYSAGREFFNNRAGLLAGLVLATSVEYFYLAKAAVTDITLTLFLTVSLLAFLRKRYYLFYACAALAVLTKGPIGLLFPGGIVLLYILFTANFAELKHMKLLSGGLLFLIITLPWYLAMYHYHGSDFVETFLGFHNMTRFLKPEHPTGTLWYYYIPVLILGFFPWSAFMPQAIMALFRAEHGQERDTLLFLGIWSSLIFIFFTLSQTKLISYILPMYPPLALIIGWYIDKIWAEKNRTAFITAAVITAVLAALFAAALLYTGYKLIPAVLPGAKAILTILTLMVISVGWFSYKRNYQAVVGVKVTGMLVFALLLIGVIFPAVAPAFSMRDFTKQFEAHYDGSAPVYVAKFYRPGFTFYSGMPGYELNGRDQLLEAIHKQQKSYFVIRKKEYVELPLVERQQLYPLTELEDKVLLVSNIN